ncbi:MAG: hypothetical protein IJK02_05630 [Clostridia bacterium]|nr:hypothetical protein [Clostridia bacterium]
MKLKGSVKFAFPNRLVLIFILIGIAFTLLRIYQTMFLIDPATGFFTDKTNPTVLLFYILAVGIALGSGVLMYLCKLDDAPKLYPTKSVAHALTSFILAIGAGVSAGRLFGSLHGPDGKLSRIVVMGIVFGFGAAAVFFADAVMHLAGSKSGKDLGALRLIPVFWMFFLTVQKFTVTASYLHCSQLMLVIFSNAFFMIFLFEYARKKTGIYAADNSAAFYTSGIVSFSFSFAVALTSLLLKFVTKGSIVNCPFEPYYIGIALFSLSSMFLMMNNRVPKEVLEEQAAQAAAADAEAEAEAADAEAADNAAEPEIRIVYAHGAPEAEAETEADAEADAEVSEDVNADDSEEETE